MKKLFNNQRSNITPEILIRIIPLIIMVGLVPLVTRVNYLKIPNDVQSTFQRGDFLFDLYHHAKMIFLLITSIIMLCILIYDYRKINFKLALNKLKNNKILAFTAGLMIILTLSTVLSPYKSVAFSGFPERYEGFFAYFSYLISIFYTLHIFNYLHDYRVWILRSLVISSIIISIWGILEYFGIYIVEMDAFKTLFVSRELINSGVNIAYSFPPKTLASTLYNPNYIGSYIPITLISSLSLFNLKMMKSKLYDNVISLVGFVLGLLTLYFSNSAAGLFSLVLIIIPILILLIIRSRNKKSVLMILVMISLVAGTLYYEEYGSEKIGFIRTEYITFISQKNNTAPIYGDITLKNGVLSIPYKDNAINLFVDNSTSLLVFYDKTGTIVPYTHDMDNNKLVFDTPPFSDIDFAIMGNYGYATLSLPNLKINVAFANNRINIINYYGELTEEYAPPNFYGFIGYERLASNRGYLWSRTLPLLKDTLLIGHGPDTFPMYFPQDDITGKSNFLFGSQAFVDKPHNMYLQYAVNLGVSFVLLFLLMIGYMFVRLVSDLIKYSKKISLERVFVFCGVLAYMIAGIANDSTVGTGPVFWCMIGLSAYYMEVDRHLSDKVSS